MAVVCEYNIEKRKIHTLGTVTHPAVTIVPI